MAIGTKSTGTFEDILMKMLQDLSVAKVMPDADMNLVMQLEMQIVQALRAPHDQQAALQMMQQGQGGMPPAGGMTPDAGAGLPPQLAMALQGMGGPGGGGAGMPPGAGGGMPPGPQGGPPAVAGLRNAGGGPQPEDIMRMMSGT